MANYKKLLFVFIFITASFSIIASNQQMRDSVMCNLLGKWKWEMGKQIWLAYSFKPTSNVYECYYKDTINFSSDTLLYEFYNDSILVDKGKCYLYDYVYKYWFVDSTLAIKYISDYVSPPINSVNIKTIDLDSAYGVYAYYDPISQTLVNAYDSIFIIPMTDLKNACIFIHNIDTTNNYNYMTKANDNLVWNWIYTYTKISSSCYSIPTSIGINKNVDENIRLYPNPFENEFTIEIPDVLDQNIKIEIIEPFSGKKYLVENIAGFNSLKINPAGKLPLSNIYLVRYYSANEIKTYKVINVNRK